MLKIRCPKKNLLYGGSELCGHVFLLTPSLRVLFIFSLLLKILVCALVSESLIGDKREHSNFRSYFGENRWSTYSKFSNACNTCRMQNNNFVHPSVFPSCQIQWIIPKKTGFNLYQLRHCAYITYSVKTWL